MNANEQNIAAKYSLIPLDQLQPNEYNARRFAENMTPQRQARFNELAESIQANGILEPLVVRLLGDGDHYEIIAGERRYRAALEVAVKTGVKACDFSIPCMIRKVDDAKAFELMIIENLQRDDLTPFETASAFRDYLQGHGNTADAAADLSIRTGIPVHAIRRQARLLDLPEEILQAWKQGSISQSHVDLFTRIEDSSQALELLAATVRMKLSTRELAERIASVSAELDRGFFDKTDCQLCPFNSSIQSGLFTDLAPAGKCGNATCFEAKQAEFLTANWMQSKAAEAYGTRGFRFGHRLGQDRCEGILHKNIADRCKECDRFVTVLRLNATIVSGYAQCCTGPAACFNELYREPAAVDQPEETKEVIETPEQKETETPDPAVATEKAETVTATPVAPAGKAVQKKKAADPPEPTGPVYDARRGQKHRKEFIRTSLTGITAEKAGSAECLRAAIYALATVSSAAKNRLIDLAGINPTLKADKFVDAVFGLPGMGITDLLFQMATAQIMSDTVPALESIYTGIASRFDIDINGWRFTEDYLAELSRNEIIRIGEEPGVDIWKDEKAEAYRKEHYKGKALMSLKKEDLIDIILKSAADLSGRIPAEVLGKKG